MESIFSCGLFVCEKSFSKISLFLSPSLFICVSMSLSLCLSVSLSLLYSTLLDQISEKWDLIFLHAGTTCGDLNITHDILMITSEDTRMTFTMALLREWWLDAWPQVPGFSLLPRAGGDPPLSKFQKKNGILESNYLGWFSCRQMDRGDEEEHFKPLSRGRGNSLRRYSTF